MRNLTNDSPTLFNTEGLIAEAVQRAESPAPEKKNTKRAEQVAKEFVKWCCGFGAGFRNSPDRANLRFWSQKTSLKLQDVKQDEILAEAQRLFAKKIEQLTRKSAASLPQMNTMSE